MVLCAWAASNVHTYYLAWILSFPTDTFSDDLVRFGTALVDMAICIYDASKYPLTDH